MTGNTQRLAFGLSLWALLGCATVFDPPKPKWPPFPDENFMHVGNYIQVAAAGRAKGKVTSETQARALARDEALLAAWSRLEAYILTLPVQSGGTVADLVASSPDLQAKLGTLVHSAEIASTKFGDDDTAAVVLLLGKDRINSLFSTGLP